MDDAKQLSERKPSRVSSRTSSSSANRDLTFGTSTTPVQNPSAPLPTRLRSPFVAREVAQVATTPSPLLAPRFSKLPGCKRGHGYGERGCGEGRMHAEDAQKSALRPTHQAANGQLESPAGTSCFDEPQDHAAVHLACSALLGDDPA